MIINDIINDILVSVSEKNEFTNDGFVKISGGVLYSKYISSVAALSFIIIGLNVYVRDDVSYGMRIIGLGLNLVIAFLLFAFYLIAGRLFRTIYIKDDKILVLDGFKHKVENYSVTDIADWNGYDGIKGRFRFMYLKMKNETKIYFNPNPNTDLFIKKYIHV